MKKWIAILFLILHCGTSLAQGTHLHFDAVEQLADSDKIKDAKQDKNDGKEYEAHAAKKLQDEAPVLPNYITHLFFWLPRPVIKKPTPPPNAIC